MADTATVRTSTGPATPVIGKVCLAIGAFLAGFVINEPAPYELFMVGLIAIWFLFGLKISANSAFLLSLVVVKRHLLLRVKATPSVTRTARFGGRTPPKSRRQNFARSGALFCQKFFEVAQPI